MTTDIKRRINVEENEGLFINKINGLASQYETKVSIVNSIYGPLKWININVPSSLDLRQQLVGRYIDGRFMYNAISIEIRNHNGYYTNKIWVKSMGPIIKDIKEIPYDWDDSENFELYGCSCLSKSITEDKMNIIINDIRLILDNHFKS